MREALAAMLVCLAGCNQLLGVEDPPLGGDACVGSCACRVDTDCGAHEYCNDQVSTRSCDCVAGYMPWGDRCAWQGVVHDPGFSDPTAWAPASLATLDAAATGMKEPGVLKLPRDACAAAAAQMIEMPRFERAEPLVAVMTYRVVEALGNAGPAFAIGQAWNETVPPSTPIGTWITERRCLGAGSYAAAGSQGRGQSVPLTLGQITGGLCRYNSLELDRFEIVPATPGECPLPGQVVNGLADDDGGWAFTTGSAGTAAFVAGVGENRTRGARLGLPQCSSSALAEVPLSPDVADATGSPSLSYYVTSTANTSIYSYLGARSLPAIPPNQPTIVRFCVPAHQRGVPQRLRVYPSYVASPCTDPINASGVLDSVKLESVAACGTDPAIADPGFESGTIGELYQSGTGTVRSIEDPGSHAGTHMLELQMSSCPSYAYAYVHAITPPASAGGGPALAFWSRMTVGSNASMRVYATGLTNIAIPRDLQWRRGVICLDPKLAGRHQELFFYLAASSCTGTVTFPAESAFVDDLEVTTDPSCPAM